MARSTKTVQAVEALTAQVEEIKTVATKKSARGTATPKPAQTGLAEPSGGLTEDDSKVATLVAKLRAMVAKAEQSAREESELFSDDESEHDLAETAARSEQLRKFRKMLKSDSTDQTMKTAISRYLESLKPADKLAGSRGRKASFLCKIGNGGNIQITGTYSNILNWESGTILEIKCENNQLILTPKVEE